MQHNKLLLFLILIIIPLPAASATNEDDEDDDETEEDIVGDILEDEGIERNPPEINDSEVAPPEVANTTGQISSFNEGPVVVVPP